LIEFQIILDKIEFTPTTTKIWFISHIHRGIIEGCLSLYIWITTACKICWMFRKVVVSQKQCAPQFRSYSDIAVDIKGPIYCAVIEEVIDAIEIHMWWSKFAEDKYLKILTLVDTRCPIVQRFIEIAFLSNEYNTRYFWEIAVPNVIKVFLSVCLSPIISSLCPYATGNKTSTNLNPVHIAINFLDLLWIFGADPSDKVGNIR
jgi:hypothetical protein